MSEYKPTPSAPETSSTPIQSWPHGPTRFEQRFGNNTTRIVVALVAIPLILGVVFVGGWCFSLLVAAMSTGALLEFYWMLEKRGIRPNKPLGIVAGLLVLLPFTHGRFSRLLFPAVEPPGYFPHRHHEMHSSFGSGMAEMGHWEFPSILAIIILLVLIAFAVELRRDNREALKNVMGTLTGFFYVSLCMATLLGLQSLVEEHALLLALRDHGLPLTPAAAHRFAPLFPSYVSGAVVLVVLVGIWTCDSFAYFGGRAFGKHKLFERVSPKKTWEGAIAGSVAAVAACIGLSILLEGPAWYDGIFIGIAAGVFGQLGDLVESHVKRGCDVKDSSQIIPGHGGILDRFDSLLFVAPLVYLYTLGVVLVS